MSQPNMKYRIWPRGSEWHWQVFSLDAVVLASGVENSSRAARTAAFAYCLVAQHADPKPS
jgi:hypothetical protein